MHLVDIQLLTCLRANPKVYLVVLPSCDFNAGKKVRRDGRGDRLC